MNPVDVLEILYHLSKNEVVVWLDGGWGVDALLGAQTRAHDDLDVVMAAAHLGAARNRAGGGRATDAVCPPGCRGSAD
jgi:lincosamide nucleotidyltransferase A/C/D/E